MNIGIISETVTIIIMGIVIIILVLALFDALSSKDK